MGPADWEPRPGDSYAFNDQAIKKRERETKNESCNSANLESLLADLSQGPFRG